jgi:hypothetical protein
MRVKVNARFATAEDTAQALGVPRRRVRELRELVSRFRDLKKAGLSTPKALRVLENGSSIETSAASKNGFKIRVGSSPLKRKSAKKVSASRKRRTRAKDSKASR